MLAHYSIRCFPNLSAWHLALALLVALSFSSGAVRGGDSPPPGSFGEYRTEGGELVIEWRADYLQDFGVESIVANGSVIRRHRDRSPLAGEFAARLSHFRFDRFVGGRLRWNSDLALIRGDARVAFGELTVVPGEDPARPKLRLLSAGGEELMALTHLHSNLAEDGRVLRIGHADVVISDALAGKLGFEALAGQVAGSAELRLNVADFEALPVSRSARGEAQCEGRPYWPQDGYAVDIALTDIGGVQYQGRDPESGGIKLAPSAWLKNIGAADVPWIAKFESNAVYPYSPNDQHPYLVWSLYRMHEGRIEQLGVSAAKHAFNTVNLNCDFECDYFEVNSNFGDVLGPGCEDVYGASTNDMNSALGPREEIIASSGAFTSTGSFFDLDGDGNQDNIAQEFEHRLLVDEADLTSDGARYFVDAWYLVQCDEDIWNSMGSVEVAPETAEDAWQFPRLGDFRQGPAIDHWIAEGAGEYPVSAHAVVTIPSETPAAGCPDSMPQGHARLLVRVDRVNGQYRYVYALQNYDLDRGIAAVGIPLAAGAQLSSSPQISGPDSSEWTGVAGSGQIAFQRAGGAVPLGWATLHTFEFTTDASPAHGALSLELAGSASPQATTVATIVPGNDLLFLDRFQNANQ